METRIKNMETFYLKIINVFQFEIVCWMPIKTVKLRKGNVYFSQTLKLLTALSSLSLVHNVWSCFFCSWKVIFSYPFHAMVTGKGAGSLIGGYMMKAFDTRPTYRMFAAACAVTGLLYFVFNTFYLRKRPQVCVYFAALLVDCTDTSILVWVTQYTIYF